MELRFLKGKWEFGKFKLQSRSWVQFAQGCGAWDEWRDVPVLGLEGEQEKKCEHSWGFYPGVKVCGKCRREEFETADETVKFNLPKNWSYCAMCNYSIAGSGGFFGKNLNGINYCFTCYPKAADILIAENKLKESDKPTPEPPKEKRGEWCEHMDVDSPKVLIHRLNVLDANFCPICGTPRPVPRSLEDEFLSIFKIHNNQYSSAKEWRKVVVKELASIARKWYEGK